MTSRHCLTVASPLLSQLCLQVPTASIVPEFNVALNRCRWHNTGTHLAVGGNNGKIYLYDVAEVSSPILPGNRSNHVHALSNQLYPLQKLATPRMDEWSKFAHSLLEMQSESADMDMELVSPLR